MVAERAFACFKTFFFFSTGKGRGFPLRQRFSGGRNGRVVGWVAPGEGASVSALVPGLAGGAPCRRSEQRETLESKQGFFAPSRAWE